eukprot:SAG31_NODE_622_length_13493_cov_7.301254_6_plen_126_part_00
MAEPLAKRERLRQLGRQQEALAAKVIALRFKLAPSNRDALRILPQQQPTHWMESDSADADRRDVALPHSIVRLALVRRSSSDALLLPKKCSCSWRCWRSRTTPTNLPAGPVGRRRFSGSRPPCTS